MNDECMRTLIVRSPVGSSPVDFDVNLSIDVKDYNKVMIQLLSVNIDQNAAGTFPVDALIHNKSFSVECNMGQLVFDTNGKRSYLGSVNICREQKRAMIYDGISQPLIELSAIPNGRFNFQLKDKDGVIPTIIDTNNDTSIQGITYVFQLYLMNNENTTKQINL